MKAGKVGRAHRLSVPAIAARRPEVLRRALALMLGAKHNAPMNTSDMARALGRKGGKVRAARLAPSERARIAALGGRARALSLHAVRRVTENFRYVDVIDALQPRPRVIRLRAFDGPLPGIYASQSRHE